MSQRRVVSVQRLKHLDVISMINKTTMENRCRFVFYNDIDIFLKSIFADVSRKISRATVV